LTFDVTAKEAARSGPTVGRPLETRDVCNVLSV